MNSSSTTTGRTGRRLCLCNKFAGCQMPLRSAGRLVARQMAGIYWLYSYKLILVAKDKLNFFWQIIGFSKWDVHPNQWIPHQIIHWLSERRLLPQKPSASWKHCESWRGACGVLTERIPEVKDQALPKWDQSRYRNQKLYSVLCTSIWEFIWFRFVSRRMTSNFWPGTIHKPKHESPIHLPRLKGPKSPPFLADPQSECSCARAANLDFIEVGSNLEKERWPKKGVVLLLPQNPSEPWVLTLVLTKTIEISWTHIFNTSGLYPPHPRPSEKKYAKTVPAASRKTETFGRAWLPTSFPNLPPQNKKFTKFHHHEAFPGRISSLVEMLRPPIWNK